MDTTKIIEALIAASPKTKQEVADHLSGKKLLADTYPLLTIPEVAEKTGLSAASVRLAMKKKKLPFIRPTGGQRYVRHKDFLDWLQNEEVN